MIKNMEIGMKAKVVAKKGSPLRVRVNDSNGWACKFVVILAIHDDFRGGKGATVRVFGRDYVGDVIYCRASELEESDYQGPVKTYKIVHDSYLGAAF